jgi:hypothetical protein
MTSGSTADICTTTPRRCMRYALYVATAGLGQAVLLDSLHNHAKVRQSNTQRIKTAVCDTAPIVEYADRQTGYSDLR